MSALRSQVERLKRVAAEIDRARYAALTDAQLDAAIAECERRLGITTDAQRAAELIEGLGPTRGAELARKLGYLQPDCDNRNPF